MSNMAVLVTERVLSSSEKVCDVTSEKHPKGKLLNSDEQQIDVNVSVKLLGPNHSVLVNDIVKCTGVSELCVVNILEFKECNKLRIPCGNIQIERSAASLGCSIDRNVAIEHQDKSWRRR